MERLEMREDIGGSVFFQFLNSVSLILAGLVFYIYIVHFYSPVLVGTVALLLAIAGLLNAFFPLGLGYGIQHFLSYSLGRGEFSTIKALISRFSAIGLALSSISLISLYFSAPVFALLFFHSLGYVRLIRFLGADIFFMVLSNFLSGILLGLQDFKSQAKWNIIGVFVTYALPVILLFYFKSTFLIVLGWATGYAISSVAYSVRIYSMFENVQAERKRVRLNPILKYSFPIFFSSLVGYGSSYADRFIVSYFLNLSSLGIYNFALLISSAIGFLAAPFTTILLPKLSEMYGQGKTEEMGKYTTKGIELLASLYSPIAMLIAALSSYILLFLSSGEYVTASLPMKIVMVSSSVFVSANILSVSLQAIRKTGVFLVSSSLALISNIAISILLIPKLHIVGAAIGYASIFAVSFFVTLFYSMKFSIVHVEWDKMWKIYASSTVMFLIVSTLANEIAYSPLKLLIFILLGFAIYAFMIRVLRTFKVTDVDFLITLLPARLKRLRRFLSILFL